MGADRHGSKPICEIRALRGLAFRLPEKGVMELQFQIKGQDYFLAFVEDERRWHLFSQTTNGVERIPVYVDVAKWERLPLRDEKPQKPSS
jgi:hypothetical protein